MVASPRGLRVGLDNWFLDAGADIWVLVDWKLWHAIVDCLLADWDFCPQKDTAFHSPVWARVIFANREVLTHAL